jgi:carbamoyl-phosphate synthase large subunit
VFNVLISSAGRRVALLESFRHALRCLGLSGEIMAADVSALSAAFQVADRSVMVPPCTSSGFVAAMLEICRDNHISLVVPTIDTELLAYAEAREGFAAIGTTVAVSSPAVVRIASDKHQTHAWLVGAGIPTVRQASADEVRKHPEEWPFPFIVKPAQGSASIGVATVHSATELAAAAQREGFIAQSIASGVEHTVDVLVDRNGTAVCAVPRRRIEVRAGEVSKGMTVRCLAIIDMATRVCEQLPGSYGPVTIQMFQEPSTEDIRVIEVNPRFGGGFPLAWQAGARFPQWLIEEVLDLPRSADPGSWRDGLVMLRYDQAVYIDGKDVGL